jgi:hypothetical protein
LNTESKKLNFISLRNPFFFKIEQLCKENNSKLILYQSPIHGIEVNLADCLYIFINHTKEYFPSEMYYDDIHVDCKGSFYCSKNYSMKFKSIIDSNK